MISSFHKNRFLIFLGISSLSISPLQGNGTVQLFTPYSESGGILSNIADANGTPSNGLYWGIIVNTNNTQFSNSYTQNFTLALPLRTTLSQNSNVLIIGGSTFDTTDDLELNPVIAGGTGSIGNMSGISYDAALGDGVDAGDTFRLVWFDTSANTAGFIDDSSFILKSAGVVDDFSSIFRGIDPIRRATGITFTPIPEPSTFLIGSVGCLMLIRRRR